jgi:hypothetical protein
MKGIKIICLLVVFLFFGTSACWTYAQSNKPKGVEKVVTGSENLNRSTQKLNEKTNAINNQVQQAGNNVKAAVENVKAVIRVFEPILGLHLKRKSGMPGVSQTDSSSPEYAGNVIATTDSVKQVTIENASVPVESNNTSSEINSEIVAESASYNADGTANLGNQNNRNFGCYVDILRGKIMDDIDVAGNTSNVDIIFTATDYYGSAPMFALLTPAYVKNDAFSNYYFRGPVYKDAHIPVKEWDEVNESQVALTALTGAQFDKIQDNNQLTAVVKKIPGFKDKFESRTKINGKVFAVKTEMGDRTAYGLLYVVDQLGTTGVNGYLKIKIKVTGFDSNGDGLPDSGLYTQ